MLQVAPDTTLKKTVLSEAFGNAAIASGIVFLSIR